VAQKDWGVEEGGELFLEQQRLVALALGSKGVEHLWYAQIVQLEQQPYPSSPYSVRDLYKHAGGGEYYWWDLQSCRWMVEGGREALWHVISNVLRKRLRTWKCLASGEVRYEEAHNAFLSIGVAEHIEKFLRPLLKDPAFQLDDDRNYLVFSNMAYRLDTDSWVPLSPHIRSSHSTGWAWLGSGLTEEEEQRVVDALEAVDTNDAVVGEEACRKLDSVCALVPDLGFLKSICGGWDRSLYCAKHLARAAFALPYQEHLWTRGPGANGKDTLANCMAKLLGGYFANLPCEALCGSREMDAPSQTILALKGKRFVAVREIARNAKIKSHIYKTIADPKGKLKARGLWGKDSEFSPHFLLYLASNVPIDLDDSSGGSARRTRILDLPFNFVEVPQAANERQKDAALELSFGDWNPTFFTLLRLVYIRLLAGKNQTNVTPVPQEIVDAVEEELEEAWMPLLVAFVQGSLVPATNAKDASSAAEVREAFFAYCGGEVPKKEVGLRLTRKGFMEDTVNYSAAFKKTSKRVYKVRLGDGLPCTVKLAAGSTGGTG